MIQVSELEKYEGVTLEIGDTVVGSSGNFPAVCDVIMIENQRSEWHVTEFTSRTNTGAQPVGDDVVVVMRGNNGIERNMAAKNVAWIKSPSLSSNGGKFCWSTWKPCIKWIQEQVELIEEDEQPDSVIFAPENSGTVAPIKPTFTQEMSDRNELPPIGSEPNFCWLIEFESERFHRTLKVIAYNEDFTQIWAHMDNNENSNLYNVSKLKFKPIQSARDKAIDVAYLKMYRGKIAPVNHDAIKTVLSDAFDAGLLKELMRND